jgi:hypothetical protein
MSADTRPLVGLGLLPEQAVVVGGAASRGGSGPAAGTGRHLTGIGDPTDSADPTESTVVVGNVGDIYQRLDGQPGHAFYVKESGNGTAMGWTAK